jgi:hypothetical protein
MSTESLLHDVRDLIVNPGLDLFAAMHTYSAVRLLLLLTPSRAS